MNRGSLSQVVVHPPIVFFFADRTSSIDGDKTTVYRVVVLLLFWKVEQKRPHEKIRIPVLQTGAFAVGKCYLTRAYIELLRYLS